MLPQTITILTATTTLDAYQNTVLDWTSPASRSAAAYVRPISTSLRPSGNEHVQVGRDVSEHAWQVHTNDQTVTAFDRVVHDGVTYEIDGEPLIWKTAPGGRMGFTKLLLRRVSG
jgi:head-tail adaptor